jgi:hypothetical protein
MTELPDQVPAAASRSHLRASHADREQVIGTLKGAFVQGRLAKDEFDLRVGQALASRTYGDLAALSADLPAGLTAAEPSKLARAPGERSILRRPGLLMTAETVLYVGMWPLALFGGRWSGRGRRIVPAGSHRGGQHLAWMTARHPGACQQLIRTGASRRPMPVTGTPPKQREGGFRARYCRFAVTAPAAPSRQGRPRPAGELV